MKTAQPTVTVHVAWRSLAPPDERVRARVVAEMEQVSWTLARFEGMLLDAHQAAGAEHAWLLPRLDLRFPVYEEGLRYRLVCTCLERPRWRLEDTEGRIVADVTLP